MLAMLALPLPADLDASLSAIADPVQRLDWIMAAGVALDALALRLARHRAVVIHDLHQEGSMTYRELGLVLGVNASRAYRLAMDGAAWLAQERIGVR